MSIKSFIDADLEKVEKLIEENPICMTTATAADFLGIDQVSVRAAIDGGAFGFAWRKPGKANKGYHIPTAAFVRWYLNVDVLEKVNRQEVTRT